MSTEAVRRREKTVTRRLGWSDLRPGTLLCAVKKAQGLKKGEHVVKLATIRVVNVRREKLTELERLSLAEQALEMRREGFPGMTVPEFLFMFHRHNHTDRWTPVNRIEFEYVEEPKCLSTSVGPRPELPLSGCDYITEVWRESDGHICQVNYPIPKSGEAPRAIQ